MSHRIDGYLSPATGAGVDGYDQLVSAQNTIGTDGYGGDLILRSGIGFADGYDGYVKIQTGQRVLVVLDGYNISLFQALGSFGNGKNVVFIANATTAPTGNPTGGGDLFVMNGDGYWRNPNGLVQSISGTRVTKDFPADANYTALENEYRANIMEFTDVSVPLTAGRDVVLPNISGYQWTVFNGVTGGAFSLTFKTPAGSGVAVGAGKRAIIYCNGTDIVRVTPDT